MALTDNEREKKSKRNKPKSMDAVGNFRYSDKQKIELATSYLATGNLALSARVHGIPEITARSWRATAWWATLIEELKMQEKLQLSAKMKQLVEASQLIVAQRLETGDPILNQKTGEIIYKPVSMKDAHKVAVDLIDRKTILDKTTKEGPTEAKNEDKLEKLAEKFAEIATKTIEKKYNKARTIDVLDVEEVRHAVHEEREEGLQNRVPEISFEAGTNQESYGTDDSPPSS